MPVLLSVWWVGSLPPGGGCTHEISTSDLDNVLVYTLDGER